MALAFVDEGRSVIRNRRFVVTQCTFDSSYPTGGEPLVPADLGLTTIDYLAANTDGSNAFVWDKPNGKLKAYTAAGAEVANATNLAAVVIRIFAVGS
jgi:hypothetical protein